MQSGPANNAHLWLDFANDRIRCISGNYLGVMQHVEFLSGITASIEEDGLLSSGVIREEAGDIKNLTIDDNPHIILLIMLRNLSNSVLGRGSLANRCGGRGGRGSGSGL